MESSGTTGTGHGPQASVSPGWTGSRGPRPGLGLLPPVLDSSRTACSCAPRPGLREPLEHPVCTHQTSEVSGATRGDVGRGGGSLTDASKGIRVTGTPSGCTKTLGPRTSPGGTGSAQRRGTASRGALVSSRWRRGRSSQHKPFLCSLLSASHAANHVLPKFSGAKSSRPRPPRPVGAQARLPPPSGSPGGTEARGDE